MIKRLSDGNTRSQYICIRRLQNQGHIATHLINGRLAYDTEEYAEWRRTPKNGRPIKGNAFNKMAMENFVKNGAKKPTTPEDEEFLKEVRETINKILKRR